MNAAVLRVVQSRQNAQESPVMTMPSRQKPMAQEEGGPETEAINSTASAQAGPNPCVLRVLTGPNTGAESVLRNERLLIGNLESECDVVLDVSRAERHACLVRVSNDGWTVLSIAGDLWVGQDYLAAQETRDITSGVVLTLGRVAFCIAHKELVDWSSVKAPFELVKPDLNGPMPSVALLPSRQEVLHKWHALKLAAGIGVASLVLASAGAFLMSAWSLRTPTAETAALQLKANQAVVSALPMGKELNVQPASDLPNKFLVQGYLPKRADLVALEFAMRKAEINAEYHLVAVDELATDLSNRFAEKDPKKLLYDKQGRFVIVSRSEQLDTQDRQARQAMQEIAALTAVNLRVDDVLDQEGKPVVVRYERSTERPGDVMVTDLDVIQQRERFVVRELRLGKFPSVVMDSGMRYFEGATLPDKSVLKQISENALVLQQGRGERTIPLPAQVLVTQADSAPIATPVLSGSTKNKRK
jgi:Inner membrane component of T3SS, cytoplasmic domain